LGGDFFTLPAPPPPGVVQENPWNVRFTRAGRKI
jgi:hypothetical protein